MNDYLTHGLLAFLVVAAIAISRTKDLLSAVIMFMAYGTVMAIIWQQLSSPDVAMTEAAIGAGVTSIMFLIAIGRTQRFER